MHRYRIAEIPEERDASPIFIGSVTRQPMITDANPDLLRANVVTFHDGARNRLHHHAADQVLIVTGGKGVVATESARVEVEPGDVIHIPSGERHWHGAAAGETFSHISILTPGDLTIDEAE